jgi:hypothetical protein
MSHTVRARVYTEGMEIPYMRAGRGPVAILLPCRAPSCRSTPSQEETPLFLKLATILRVIAPLVAPPAGRHEGERWLRGIIDGLGLDRPAVVVDRGLVPLVVRCLRRDPQRIGAVLVLPEPEDIPGILEWMDRFVRDAAGLPGAVTHPQPGGV